MSHQNQIVTIFGGSGFVGRAIARILAGQGFIIRVATRNPQACYQMKPYGTPGQIVAQGYDPARPETIAAAIAGSYAVINCVGILYQHGRTTFHSTHTELPRQIATACKRHSIPRLVHISALGVEQSKSKYGQSKLKGEQAVMDIFPAATILRPSVIFGAEDHFFNMFATMARYSPALPLIGGGHTKFQPVYVDDVARAVAAVLQNDVETRGQVYELGGPDVVTFRDIYAHMFAATGQTRALINLPWSAAKLQAWFAERLPGRVLTVDQVTSLKTDNIVQTSARTFKDLGVTPTAMDTVLPTYLDRFRVGGKFAELKRA